MKWRDPQPVTCPRCGRRSLVGVADLRSLRATCPRCGGSLARAGERMLAEEARLRPIIDQAIAEVWAEMDAEEAAEEQRPADPGDAEGSG